MKKPYACEHCGTVLSIKDIEETEFGILPVRSLEHCYVCKSDQFAVCLWQFEGKYFPVRFELIPSDYGLG